MTYPMRLTVGLISPHVAEFMEAGRQSVAADQVRSNPLFTRISSGAELRADRGTNSSLTKPRGAAVLLERTVSP